MEATPAKTRPSTSLHQRPVHEKFSSTSAYLYLTCLLLCAPLTSQAQNCALYDPPVPGITCFRGEEVLRAITNSPTGWMIELYSSWCGHCQHFAPAMKELGRDVKRWSSVIRIGVVDCTGSKENQDVCTKFSIGGYPSIKVYSLKLIHECTEMQ